MAITKLSIAEFLTMAKTHPVLDVRSPGEFEHAHIPGAYNLPLFTNEERKVVGTAYKQESKQIAIKLGMKYFGVKMVQMVEEVELLLKNVHPNKKKNTDTAPPNFEAATVLVHCWRGGMRSAGVAWMLDLYGFKVYSLVGGYKGYRNWALEQFQVNYPISILGGYTGSGKTEVLKVLADKGEIVIDLEGMAHHKGSSFGGLGQLDQPSQEHFENTLALALYQANVLATAGGSTQAVKKIWIEDESQRIGNVNVPAVLFQQLRKKTVYFLNIPFEERLNFINTHYGKFQQDKLVSAVMRIKKRLGGLETKTAVILLIENDTKEAFRILLKYYDKGYEKGLENNRENINELVKKIDCVTVNDQTNASILLQILS